MANPDLDPSAQDIGDFVAECRRLLYEIHACMEKLEADPDNPERSRDLFMTMYAIKGTVGRFTYHSKDTFLECLQFALSMIRSGDLDKPYDVSVLEALEEVYATCISEPHEQQNQTQRTLP